ncbi:hypothetical protein [Mesorhizobium sp. B4-1-4]|uniref:hypothetical protein n=1 Tax=Mesorhizobium sp. B4-1-4 TaxID=2589888 RepID=UPI00112DCCF2|nr:hypothetical protein [Mesorhizobium sp. B4-1-4]UCI32531.1 hypothetical protein FJW03_03490 [Mesorhizobium sp. B4-1-4]
MSDISLKPPIPFWATLPRKPYGRLSTGIYRVVVTGAEKIKPQNFDPYIAFKFLVILGDNAGVTFADHMFTHHQDEWVQEEEYQRLSCLVHACAVPVPGHVDKLYGIPLEVQITTVGRTTVITNYRAVNGIWFLPSPVLPTPIDVPHVPHAPSNHMPQGRTVITETITRSITAVRETR